MSKLISVSDEVYTILSKYKGSNKSFSMVIKEFIENRNRDKSDIMKFAGILKMSDEEAEEFKKRIKENRKNFFRKGL